MEQGHSKVTARSEQGQRQKGHSKVTARTEQHQSKDKERTQQRHSKVIAMPQQGQSKVTARTKRGHSRDRAMSQQGQSKDRARPQQGDQVRGHRDIQARKARDLSRGESSGGREVAQIPVYKKVPRGSLMKRTQDVREGKDTRMTLKFWPEQPEGYCHQRLNWDRRLAVDQGVRPGALY